jgi:antitoxin component YwqK of YwqJK toxin-antitoxin module
MKRLLLIVLPLLLIVGCSKPKDVSALQFDSYGLANNHEGQYFSGKVFKDENKRKLVLKKKYGESIKISLEHDYEGGFKDGMKFGLWKYYDNNGKIIKEIDYKIFEGLENNFWFYNGEKTIKDGEKVLSKYSYYLDEQQHKIKDGNYINFYEETKTPQLSGNYKNNIPVGVWSDWYMNSPTKRFSQYPLNQYGRVDGTQITWEIDGLIIGKVVYEDGKQVGESIFIARYNNDYEMSGYWDLGVLKFNLHSNGTGTVKSKVFGIDQTSPIKWRISDDVILWEQTDGKGSGTSELYIRDGGKRLSLLP